MFETWLLGGVALAVAVAFGFAVVSVAVAVAVAVADTYVYIFIDTYYFVSCFSVIVADVVHLWHAGGILH